MAQTPTTSPATSGSESERVAVQQPEGTERTRTRPIYAPRVDILETEDALEIVADMPGVTKDSVEVTLEQRVLNIRGRAGTSLPEDLAPLYLEYQPGDYERRSRFPTRSTRQASRRGSGGRAAPAAAQGRPGQAAADRGQGGLSSTSRAGRCDPPASFSASKHPPSRLRARAARQHRPLFRSVRNGDRPYGAGQWVQQPWT